MSRVTPLPTEFILNKFIQSRHSSKGDRHNKQINTTGPNPVTSSNGVSLNGKTKLDLSQPEATGNIGSIQIILMAGNGTFCSHQSNNGSRSGDVNSCRDNTV